ncbi:Deoxyribodipyrimidine photo-lyase [bacterium HR41]|nr:Deoxyribodipyrimidine photo-lyase [bacterium HR41]
MALRPELARCEVQAPYRTIAWADDPDAYAAWRDGRTGYPLVDAAMRQLAEEGWVHNRARLVAGSFLTKHLGIDWRLGERWYMRSLVDGDEASNNGNWQWIASVGSDPAPPARRILNPTLQAERFDTEGRYIRRYVPELASVPDRWLREPWRMPRGVQEATGCVIGRDYPAPIVDHRSARLRALERYRAARAAAQGHDRR